MMSSVRHRVDVARVNGGMGEEPWNGRRGLKDTKPNSVPADTPWLVEEAARQRDAHRRAGRKSG